MTSSYTLSYDKLKNDGSDKLMVVSRDFIEWVRKDDKNLLIDD